MKTQRAAIDRWNSVVEFLRAQRAGGSRRGGEDHGPGRPSARWLARSVRWQLGVESEAAL
jgi:hypothetical protein